MQADPRALRSAATATAAVLALVLVTDGVRLPVAQAAVLALGVVGASPYGMVFKGIVKSPPRESEDARPPRFAQPAGPASALAALVGHATQIAPPALGATAAACSPPFSTPHPASASAARRI
ncbi:DUF4395 family protein [Planomonospora parontospora]|uniref:DUF4395 family protein n=1 Tax=Planomonospora parontospora TaxID=58119 RepID=UPI0019B4924A|nr:DUF4395 family protein [Planomonospora parontospora]GGL23447.1 hypothetical protein GCM10014719_26510 [Planomonospora parontospora subsp. antibiotica]GII15015.1 hypothetical protein Ppa05_17410 [Planomonospora parontospora subsp. antibiotica]